MGVDVGVSLCRLLMVVHSFPRLSLRLLSDRLGLIDSLLTHAHTTAAKHTPGKIAVLGLRDRDPGLSCQGRRSSGQQIHAQAVCPTKAVGAATGNPTWSGPSAQQIVLCSLAGLGLAPSAPVISTSPIAHLGRIRNKHIRDDDEFLCCLKLNI